jgi:hypothetical protein
MAHPPPTDVAMSLPPSDVIGHAGAFHRAPVTLYVRRNCAMNKVVSNEQRLANRQNAQQSTDPKTPTSKARSSRASRLNSTIPTAPSPSFAASLQCHMLTLTKKLYSQNEPIEIHA